jgi:hypothetical protein
MLRSQSSSPGVASGKAALNGQLAGSSIAAASLDPLWANPADDFTNFTCDAPRHFNSAAAAGIGHLSQPTAGSAATHASFDVLGSNAPEHEQAGLKALAVPTAVVGETVTNSDSDMQELGPLTWTAIVRLNWRLCVAVSVLYACTLSIFPGFLAGEISSAEWQLYTILQYVGCAAAACRGR